MAEGGEDKTEAPTPKKLAEARKQGQFVKSPDISTWVGVAAVFTLLPLAVRPMRKAFDTQFHTVVELVGDPDPQRALAFAHSAIGSGLRSAGVVCVAAMLIAVVANIAQSGLHLATKAAKPQFSRLNPAKGLKRIFSPHTAWETVKLLVKTAAVGVVLWRTMKSLIPQLVGSGVTPMTTVLAETLHGVNGLVRAAVAAGLVIAALDYMVARRRVMKQLRMTRKEVMDEHKQSEGDPHVKSQRRSRQMAISRNRMMREVATADVVLVNPTHVAVALRYEPAKGAPRVVAKGADNVAARIRDLARDNRVPMVENVPLARAVYAAVDVGHEIPMELYSAIAQVLAFVMRLKTRGAGSHKLQVPDIPADTSLQDKRRARREARRRARRKADPENPVRPSQQGES